VRHTTTITALLAAACLALAGCSDSDPAPAGATPSTASASPTLSEAEARQACVDAWVAVLKGSPSVAPDVDERPPVCEGLRGQAQLLAEAMRERNEENRARLG